jgi:hypothetical protein
MHRLENEGITSLIEITVCGVCVCRARVENCTQNLWNEFERIPTVAAPCLHILISAYQRRDGTKRRKTLCVWRPIGMPFIACTCLVPRIWLVKG